MMTLLLMCVERLNEVVMSKVFKTLNFRSNDGFGIDISKNLLPFLKKISSFFSFDVMYERQIIILDELNFTKYEVRLKHKFSNDGYIFIIEALSNFDYIQVYTNAPYKHLRGLLSNLKYHADEVSIISENEFLPDNESEYIDKLEEAFNTRSRVLFDKLFKEEISLDL